MTETKNVAKTTATTTRRRKTTKKAVEEVVFNNVKDIAEHYFMSAKNVRRHLRQHKDDLNLSSHQKNAIYAFNAEQSEAIKDYFDSKYAKKEEEEV